MSDSVSRPPTFTEAMNELIPEYRADEPWYLKAADIGSIVPRLLVGGARSAFDVIDRSMWSGNLLTDPHQQQELARTIIPAGLGLTFAPLRPPGSLGIFGGVRSATADLGALANAKGFAPAARDLTWKSTGWGKMAGGDWAYEINDFNSGILPDFVNYDPDPKGWDVFAFRGRDQAKLEEVLHHPELYAAYPKLKDTVVRPTPLSELGNQGKYDPNTGDIYVTPGLPLNDAHKTLLHEIQHKVQHIEGFETGGSPTQFLPPNFYSQFDAASNVLQPYLDKITDQGINPYQLHQIDIRLGGGVELPGDREYMAHARAVLGRDYLSEFLGHYNNWKSYADQHTQALEDYRRIAGEAQSFNVEHRMGLTEQQRREESPWQGMPGNLKLTGRLPPPTFPYRLIQVDHDPFR